MRKWYDLNSRASRSNTTLEHHARTPRTFELRQNEDGQKTCNPRDDILACFYHSPRLSSRNVPVYSKAVVCLGMFTRLIREHYVHKAARADVYGVWFPTNRICCSQIVCHPAVCKQCPWVTNLLFENRSVLNPLTPDALSKTVARRYERSWNKIWTLFRVSSELQTHYIPCTIHVPKIFCLGGIRPSKYSEDTLSMLDCDNTLHVTSDW